MVRERILHHPQLGQIKGVAAAGHTALTQFLGIPYARSARRWGRATLLRQLPTTTSLAATSSAGVFAATRPGATSIQPHGSVTVDAASNQLPTEGLPDDEAQAEDCLNLNITVPSGALDMDGSSDGDKRLPRLLPVVVFIHGGAFFLGSGSRPYYSPLTFCAHALQRRMPVVFVALNYRLGALGFFHCPEAAELVPPNTGLHDQLVALEWVREHVGGFGGDAENVTVLGQSAGGESIALHSLNAGLAAPAYRRAVMFSGSPVTMPCMTPEQHGDNFREQARKLGLLEEGRSMVEVARRMLDVDVEKIRELGFVGAPCSRSDMLPYEKPTMQLARSGTPRHPSWAGEQLVSTTTYDGGISYNMLVKDGKRRGHAKAFTDITTDVLGKMQAQRLVDMYGITSDDFDDDEAALRKICLFESDIGFFAAALSVARGGRSARTYLQVFDLGNPFEGPLEKGRFATHTWDIVALLGAYEERLSEGYKRVIADWRDKVLDFVSTGEAPCEEYMRESGRALLVEGTGVRAVSGEEYMAADSRRRERLLELAESVDADTGWDVLWEKVCRRFLMAGE